MSSVIPDRIAGLIFQGLGPLLGLFRVELRLKLRPTDRVASRQYFGDKVVGRYFGVSPDFEAGAGDGEGSISAVEEQATHALPGAAGRGFAVLADRGKIRVFDNRVLPVGHFAVVFKEESATGAVNGFRRLRIEEPMDQVEGVLAEVGHLASGIIPEPTEMINTAIGIIPMVGSGSEHHIPVQVLRG